MTATCPGQDAATDAHPALARIEPALARIEPALARIEPARQFAGLPVVRGHRPPRFAVRLDPPADAGPLLKQVKDALSGTGAHDPAAFRRRRHDAEPTHRGAPCGQSGACGAVGPHRPADGRPHAGRRHGACP
jgi:hypothetical protein